MSETEVPFHLGFLTFRVMVRGQKTFTDFVNSVQSLYRNKHQMQ